MGIGQRITIHLHFLLSVCSLLIIANLQLNSGQLLIVLGLLLFGVVWGMGNGIAFPIALAAPRIIEKCSEQYILIHCKRCLESGG